MMDISILFSPLAIACIVTMVICSYIAILTKRTTWPIKKGRPSKIKVQFTKEVELRFDFKCDSTREELLKDLMSTARHNKEQTLFWMTTDELIEKWRFKMPAKRVATIKPEVTVVDEKQGVLNIDYHGTAIRGDMEGKMAWQAVTIVSAEIETARVAWRDEPIERLITEVRRRYAYQILVELTNPHDATATKVDEDRLLAAAEDVLEYGEGMIVNDVDGVIARLMNGEAWDKWKAECIEEDDEEPDFKYLQWVRTTREGSVNVVPKDILVQLVRRAGRTQGHAVVWEARTETGHFMVVEDEIEPALPHIDEWWKFMPCELHGGGGKPFKVIEDEEHKFVKCCCLVPVKFGSGEQSSDPIKPREITFGSPTKSVKIGSQCSIGAQETSFSEFNPKDWVRKVSIGQLGVVVRDPQDEGKLAVQYNDHIVRYDANTTSCIEPALPENGEWWEFVDMACAHRHGIKEKHIMHRPNRVVENCRARSPMGKAALCGCLIPSNFGKGSA